MSSWIKEFKGNKESKSSYFDANFLFHQDKFYIMDNHRCAFWCWIQALEKNSAYNYFHIDRHYDWLNNKQDLLSYLKKHKIEIDKLSFDQYDKLMDMDCENWGIKNTRTLFTFDNYLPFCHQIYPNYFCNNYFATHKDGCEPEGLDYIYEPPIYDLFGNISYWINEGMKKNSTDGWIFNLDIDYFFQDHRDEPAFQILTDDYVIEICEQLEEVLDKVKVVTIAMSPEFCGGWENSYRLTKIVSDYFKLDFSLKLNSNN